MTLPCPYWCGTIVTFFSLISPRVLSRFGNRRTHGRDLQWPWETIFAQSF